MRISVIGTSRVKVPAECARVSFAVGERGVHRDAVVGAVSERAQEVRALLSKLTPDDDGDAAHLSGLRTWTDFPTDRDPIHVAHVDGSVTVRELDELGGFLARLAEIEGVTVNQVQWQLTQDTRDALGPEAIRDAFQDARQRAQWIASAAGHERLSVVAVTDGGGGPPMPFGKAMMLADSGPSLDLDPVDVEIAVSLTVEFEA